jgi:hypothetical protein
MVSGVVGDSVRWRAHDSGWLAGCVRAVTTGKRGRGRRAWMNILERSLRYCVFGGGEKMGRKKGGYGFVKLMGRAFRGFETARNIYSIRNIVFDPQMGSQIWWVRLPICVD